MIIEFTAKHFMKSGLPLSNYMFLLTYENDEGAMDEWLGRYITITNMHVDRLYFEGMSDWYFKLSDIDDKIETYEIF